MTGIVYLSRLVILAYINPMGHLNATPLGTLGFGITASKKNDQKENPYSI
jgi:hypothetical protein